MTREEETALHNFESLVRQLMAAYSKELRTNDALRTELEACRRQVRSLQDEMAQKDKSYEALRTARILEVSSDDVKQSRAKIARLIRDVDKCIAMLDV